MTRIEPWAIINSTKIANEEVFVMRRIYLTMMSVVAGLGLSLTAATSTIVFADEVGVAGQSSLYGNILFSGRWNMHERPPYISSRWGACNIL